MNWLMMFYLTILSIWDIREKKIPIQLLVLGTSAVCVICAINLFFSGDLFWKIVTLIYGVVPGGCMIAIAIATEKIGLGDGWTMMIVGLVLNYKMCIAILAVSMLLMAICSMAMLIARKVNRNTKLPYLPFLAMAWFLMVIL